MNKTERKMRDILIRGKEDFGVVSVKAEFEAEGTRVDELLRLVDISRSAGLELTVKIGGCEAVRDLLEAKQIGVKYIVAPMVETPYALSKYISAKNSIFRGDDIDETEFLFNLETQTGFGHLEALAAAASEVNGIQGMVFGRVDFAGSMNLGRDEINSKEITSYVLRAAEVAKSADLDFVMGGAISSDSLHVIREIAGVHLSRFETRKVVFSGDATTIENIEQGLVNAVHFELLWLTNKRDYYEKITREDAKRIQMLESRWNLLNS
jgi:citrate lyase beta subunit